ncbi:MAG: hypothetical protein ACFB10_17295 [Salibacteraceae bacterium]
MKTLRLIFRRLLQTGLFGLLFLLVLEWAYRQQWMDFYTNEFHFLNPVEVREGNPNQPTLMVFGDSFTANPHNYSRALAPALPGWRIINHGVPGIGARQMQHIAQNRLPDSRVDAVVVQLYVGNDLLDQCPPVDWARQNWLRNGYHLASRYFQVVPFLNYRMGQWKNTLNPDSTIQNYFSAEDQFAVERYNPRIRRMLREHPNYLQESIALTEQAKAIHREMCEDLSTWMAPLPDSVPVLVVVIPHAIQVQSRYQQNFEQLGAVWEGNTNTQLLEYPFIEATKRFFEAKKQIRVVNPLNQFQQNDTFGHPLYLPNDPHLSPLGQELLAKIILNAWEEIP